MDIWTSPAIREMEVKTIKTYHLMVAAGRSPDFIKLIDLTSVKTSRSTLTVALLTMAKQWEHQQENG